VENLFDFGYGVLAWEDNDFFNSLGDDLIISHTASFGSASVPEPSIIALMGAGLIGLGFARRRNKS